MAVVIFVFKLIGIIFNKKKILSEQFFLHILIHLYRNPNEYFSIILLCSLRIV